jgi:hypothetical protein
MHMLYSFCDSSLNHEIYDFYFKNVEVAAVAVYLPKKFATLLLKFSRSELNILKSEMKSITKVKKYESDPNYFKTFKEGFHAMYIYQKNGRYNMILYSITEKSMIVREEDFKKGVDVSDKSIVVYQFPMSQRIVKILTAHEKKAPKEGYFIDHWPL